MGTDSQKKSWKGKEVLEASDSNVLLEKVSKLEDELFDYQHEMGLLLMGKKEMSSKCEHMKQMLDEAKHALKREQNTHFLAISKSEMREENLRKALGVEKQRISDLEKTLHDMRAEYAQMKLTADSKLAEANALAIRIEEKSLEVEASLREADAKHAEASRKISEMEHLSEKAQIERSEMIYDIELRKREVEVEMQKKMEEMERGFCEKKRCFEDKRDKDLIRITSLRMAVESETDYMKAEKSKVEKQKEELETNRRNLEEERHQIQKDIDQLAVLSGKLKNQREQFVKERERFITFVKEHEFKGNVSALLRKCASKIFLFSPTKNSENTALQNFDNFVSASEGLEYGVVSDSVDGGKWKAESGENISVTEVEPPQKRYNLRRPRKLAQGPSIAPPCSSQGGRKKTSRMTSEGDGGSIIQWTNLSILLILDRI